MAKTKLINGFPVNSNGEIVAQTGIGGTTIVGIIPTDEFPVDPTSGALVIAGLSPSNPIVVSSAPPNNADGRPDGTIYIQTV